jgi:hypothetical protein
MVAMLICGMTIALAWVPLDKTFHPVLVLNCQESLRRGKRRIFRACGTEHQWKFLIC